MERKCKPKRKTGKEILNTNNKTFYKESLLNPENPCPPKVLTQNLQVKIYSQPGTGGSLL
jgi:hypothetical protein